MAITLEHFCTKTGKPIIANGEPITEKIEHCLAEYFTPSSTFKLGTVYQGLTTEEDLLRFEGQGLSLEFAADRRFYFMDFRLRDQIFDQPHFGAAYGSNLFTPCKSFSERENLRVLVVDAKTGENGGVMPNSDAIALDELQEIIGQAETKEQKPATQQAEIKASGQKQSDTIEDGCQGHRVRSTKGDMPKGHPISERTNISTIDTPRTEPVEREEWEKQMLKLALAAATPFGSIACLKDNPANAGEEMQTVIFGNGKYRVIYHTPSQMLRIVDEENHRGTLYKVQKEKSVQVCEFTSDEKRSFEQLVKLDKHLEKSIPKGLQRE